MNEREVKMVLRGATWGEKWVGSWKLRGLRGEVEEDAIGREGKSKRERGKREKREEKG